MATTRIKDLSKTATTVNSDANLVLDGNTGGTQKISRDNFRQDTADAFVAAPGTYNLAPLNSGTGKIDAVYLSSSSDTPKGAWDASTNTPTLADGSGTAGDYYDVTVAGSSDLGSGSIAFTVGDVVKYNGTVWFKIDSVANILDGVSTIDGAKTAIEIPDVGTAPNEVPLNGMLGDMAYQSSDGVSVATLEVTDKIDGSLGIGVTPDKPLHVGGAGEQTLRLENTSDGLGDGSVVGSIEFEANDSSTNGSGVVSKIQSESLNATGNLFGLSFHTGHGGSMTEKMLLDNDGKLGIGHSTPQEIIHAKAADPAIRLEDTSAGGSAEIEALNGSLIIGSDIASQVANSIIAFKVDGVEGWRIDSSGNLVANGTAIDFGSTNSTSGVTVDGSVMSEYESGTWTPAYSTTGSAFTTPPTMDVPTARYVRVGDLVTFHALIRTDSVDLTGAGGYLIITGLPYAATASSGYTHAAATLGQALFWANAPAGGYVDHGQSYIYLTKRTSSITGSLSEMTPSDLTAGTTANQNQIMIAGSYYTNA